MSLANLPIRVNGTHYQRVELEGSGLSGILTEQAGFWYKANANADSDHDSDDPGDVGKI